MNSDSTRKVWQNATLGFLFIEIMGFLNISREAKIYKIFKTWENRIPIVREDYEKTQVFQGYGFLTDFT